MVARNGVEGRGDAALVAALASGATYEQAAKRASVSVRTVSRRMEDAAFQGKVRSAQSRIVSPALALLTASIVDAAETLRDLLSSPSDAVRLGAARTVVDFATRTEERLTETLAEAPVRMVVEYVDDWG